MIRNLTRIQILSDLQFEGTAMTRAFVAIAVFCGLIVPKAAAQIRDFPYEARVVVDETYVRSGPGDSDKYYPTQKLTRESVVRVLRHDPGGWYMIDPPEGSFCWVPERYVQKTGDTEGQVKEEGVAVWTGSEFGDEASIFQCMLKTGDKVTILDSRVIDTTSGPQKMLRIRPPARERRWIPGAALLPVDEQRRKELNADPYAVPENARRPDGPLVTPSQILNSKSSVSAGVTDVPPIGPSAQLAHLQQLREEQKRLAEIDQRFRDMILQDVSKWDLESIEQQYRSLQETATQKQIAGQIDMRYPAIERYRRRMSRAQELREITARTEMKDAQLVAGLQGFPGFFPPALSSPGPETVRIPGQAPQLAEAFEQFLQRDTSNIAAAESPSVTQVPAATPPANPTSANVITPGSPQNQYIGAGIVQRAAENSSGSGFVLMAPSGRILADLKATGSVELEQFVGQQVGIHGARWSEKEKRDIIEVSSLQPVRLRQ